ncbi:MAG TPA: hypothetical protein P5527_05125 [Kiritimatiellia bacterium]|nr:hypothetical protein [Kiritimatiellia bacterium]
MKSKIKKSKNQSTNPLGSSLALRSGTQAWQVHVPSGASSNAAPCKPPIQFSAV